MARANGVLDEVRRRKQDEVGLFVEERERKIMDEKKKLPMQKEEGE